jgi:predicted nucleic-acid-binding protein
VRSSLQNYEKSGIDFPDVLMAKVNLAHGCEATATFDRKAARVEGFLTLT